MTRFAWYPEDMMAVITRDECIMLTFKVPGWVDAKEKAFSLALL